MDKALTKAKVDELIKWMNLAGECKKEIEKLKGEFQKLGIEELADKKVKQTEFWGTNNSKVIVTCNESLKVVSHTFLQQILGDVLNDFSSEKVTHEYSDPFKHILASIFQGTYIEEPVSNIINQITKDEKVRKTIKKKLKGNWNKDIITLQTLVGLKQDDAEHYAFFIQEAVNYEKIVQLLTASGHQPDTPSFVAALQAIKNAVIVDEGIKVGIEAEETA